MVESHNNYTSIVTAGFPLLVFDTDFFFVLNVET
jgi:hypothetical protein